MRIKFILKVLLILRICGLSFSLCEVESGEAVLILSILESNDSQIPQETNKLPINGNSSEISLQLLNSDKFYLTEWKTLKLLKPLDRDENDSSSVTLQLSCENKFNGNKTIIPTVIRVLDINDNAPRFQNLPYFSKVSESVPVGTTIFRNVIATDLDSGVNGLVEYYIVPSGNGSEADGFLDTFMIKYPQDGHVILKHRLDYEKIDKYLITIEARDQAANVLHRLSSTATLTVNVEDSDDLDPVFVYEGCYLVGSFCSNPEYSAEIISGKVTGMLTIKPSAIKAMDRDSFNSSIKYEFHGGAPENFHDFFVIDPLTGKVRQTNSVDRKLIPKFSIIVKAEEQTEQMRFATAKLIIFVQPADIHRPQLKISSNEGHIQYPSLPGTFVTSNALGSDVIRFNITDEDLEPDDQKPKYIFEVTTSAFKVNQDGILTVNDGNLREDQPDLERYKFQVVAREVNTGIASDPVSVTVHLNSFLPQNRINPIDLSLNVSYEEHNAHEDGNITARHSLRTSGFSDRILHDIESENGKLEHQLIFPSKSYTVSINEGAPINSWLLTFKGIQPRDGIDITYKIISGNEDGTFHLSPVTGVLSLSRPLDREQSENRHLCVEARDSDGLVDTADVNVQVTDINDCNPSFIGQPYSFQVEEGIANAFIGTVKAVDEDSGLYGFVTYSVSADSDFSVDSISGRIRTTKALDYEQQPLHHVIITARDGAHNPRIGTATVTVIVIDLPDVPPVFLTRYYKASVPENAPAVNIIQVSAVDVDSSKEITYFIRNGPSQKFFIDPMSGVIGSLTSLDYEEGNLYEIVVGTLQNMGMESDATCVVKIQVLDVNDVAPLFTSVPHPIRIPDRIKIGTTLTTVVAIDGDGSAPNNVVKYSMDQHDYFIVDQDTGVVRVSADLSQERHNAMKIHVRAYDLGSPPMTSSITILVYIDHHRTSSPPASAMAFADTKLNVEVEENAVGNKLLKTIVVMHRTGPKMDVGCEISKGNDLGHFYVETSSDGDCDLKTQGQKLDFEAIKQYNLVITLTSKSEYINPSRSVAEVIIRIVDANDNRPQFVFKYPENQLTGQRYVAGISSDTPAFTPFTKVEAIDSDSGLFGQLEYSLEKDSDVGNFFTIDKQTGIISNRRTFENLIPGDPPFNLTVIVRDFPQNLSMSLNSTAQLTVNLIRDENRFILGIAQTTADVVKNKAEGIIEILQEKSNFIARIEKIDSRKVIKDNKSIIDPSGSDVWFYMTDPATSVIMTTSNELLSKNFLNLPLQRVFLYSMSGMVGINANSIRTPENVIKGATMSERTVIVSNEVDGFPAALIVLASIVAILSVVGIIYISFLWSKYRSRRNRLNRLTTTPRYDSVFIETKPKPYETQVLQMNVPLDEDVNFAEELIDNHGHHPHCGRFKDTLDTASYVTKFTNDGSHSGLGNGSFTESDSFDGRGRRELLPKGKNNMTPVHNPVYHSGYSSDENGEHYYREDGVRVHFGDNISPVPTTTEL